MAGRRGQLLPSVVVPSPGAASPRAEPLSLAFQLAGSYAASFETSPGRRGRRRLPIQKVVPPPPFWRGGSPRRGAGRPPGPHRSRRRASGRTESETAPPAAPAVTPPRESERGGGGWAEEGGSDSTSAAEECATKLEPFTSGAEGPFRPLSEPDVRRAGSPAPSRRPRPLAQAPPRGGRWARGAGGAGGGRPPSLPQGPGSRASPGGPSPRTASAGRWRPPSYGGSSLPVFRFCRN